MSRSRSPIETRCYRASSWIKRAVKLDVSDLDGRFIFYWVAFNALYGQPKYLEDQKGTAEEHDFQKFLNLMIALDNGGSISQAFRAVKEHCQKLLDDKFLSDPCWKHWHRNGIVTTEQRRRAGYIDKYRGTELNQVFHRVYVLRKQILHGCSTDGGSKNREMLSRAVIVLAELVPLFRDIVKERGRGQPLLESVPYPPSS